MATIKEGIMGGFSGKVGTVIGGNYNGKDYMRGIAPAHKDSKSPAQLDQRARFKTIIKFIKPLRPFLKVGFRKRKAGLSAYNAATSINLQEALSGIYPNYSIDYSKAMVSQGPLPEALNPLAVAREAGQIEFSWDNNSGRTYAMASDKSILVAYNQEKKKVISSMNTRTRANGSYSLSMPAGFKGDTIHCYIAFQDAGETTVSNSQYAGAVNLL